ncbi:MULTISPECIES: MarR family winged helix-turn-helix transcriptional regulator [Rhodococcus]|uniref:MarR family winged helix-turn-helix transcriptional regulator n=1 Tax=Rhodococcus oxybenzonivorans TaxID=1990687 RepID=A0AAE4UWF4_9NOCA|nr:MULTISPECIES: MarR family winged helix-turn-helix transcriptional regulator [Rhodococcus]MDV7243378.1 MarR family winged helix-turn-helix transcriptional regulator [Rhodococcus oxybenzonivorans]MDV7263922.1 MarR family winged helix-turn-helix transcriptional regulator [Rhodococcus oxybenzonivorans]MDV7276804.1 MarR family winged helix-turn-helix transcriptional regulator [Rhodococcus oxybenzonivorans]MDV7334362.1 MarR family winged helix-turn-helix transcriptional regulator [Rhodococcus oxyb
MVNSSGQPQSLPGNVADADCDLGWSVSTLQRRFHSLVATAVAELPHGTRSYQLLHTVLRKELPTQLGLADYLGIDRTVITYVIDALVEAGLVERVQDPVDRRARKVVPTDLGTAHYTVLERNVRVAEESVLRVLDGSERALFRSLLSRVARGSRDDLT